MAYIPLSKIREMTDDELIELSQERNRKNLLTQNAENAMQVRRERAGTQTFFGISRKTSFAATLKKERGDNITKKFK